MWTLVIGMNIALAGFSTRADCDAAMLGFYRSSATFCVYAPPGAIVRIR